MASPRGEQGAGCVLIVTASMGAGHDGAARELGRRLEARGLHTATVDYLELVPLRLGAFARWLYRVQLQHVPWTYELSYRLHRVAPRALRGGVARVNTLLAGRALRRTIAETRPQAIVSTYPFSSLVLGRLRAKGRIAVPVATYLTDFAVHPLWVHPSIDLHLAVSDWSAAQARRIGGRHSIATGPMVTPRRDGRSTRAATRAALGIPLEARVVLVVAGSWGVGDVERTVRDVELSGEYHVIVVCGRDQVLERRLLARGVRGAVVGWTDDMNALMVAADVLLENAGGLTTMEAFASGLSVVTYRPIAGHGRANASAMAARGMSRYPADLRALASALAESATPGAARTATVSAARRLFATDPAEHVVALVVAPPTIVAVSTGHPRTRRVVVALTAGVMAFGLLTEGTEALAARGVGLAHPPAGERHSVYLGVRVDTAALHDARVIAVIAQQGSLVVDARTAAAAAAPLRTASADGVDVENGGLGARRRLPWTRARADCAQSSAAIALTTGVSTREFVTTDPPDAFHEVACRLGRDKQRIVLARSAFRPTRLPATMRRHGIYVLDARRATPNSTRRAITTFLRRAHAADLRVRPLRSLQ